MNEPKNSHGEIKIDTELLRNIMVNVSDVHINVSQNLIITTEDKLRLCLSEHLKRMERKNSWITPLGILIAILVTLVTSTFKDVGLSADTWRAIFIIAGVLSLGWLIWSIKEAWKSEKIEDIVEELKRTKQQSPDEALKVNSV
jgi:hypothetical protein